MLDLVVEAVEHEIGEPAARNISGSDHLAAGEAGRRRGFDDRHPLVVGGEADAQVEREDRLLYGDEGQCLDRGEHQQHHRQVGFPLPAWRDPLRGEEFSGGRDA